jgi:hypothetical protein
LKIVSPFLRRFLRSQRLPSKDLQLWRNELLTAILLVALILGGVTAVPSIWMAIRDQFWAVLGIDIVAIFWIFILWKSRTLSSMIW